MHDRTYSKLEHALKYYLVGAKFHLALKAFNFAKQHHGGLRKDGVTPEFQHQLEIALYVTTLKGIPNEEELIFYALMHDVLEDNSSITIDDLLNELFPKHWVENLLLISKKYRGQKTVSDLDAYFYNMIECPSIILVKGIDRINNLQTMGGVFTIEKQLAYVTEVRTYFLPTLKIGAAKAPELFPAFMNVRTVLKCQVGLIEQVIEASTIEKQQEYYA